MRTLMTAIMTIALVACGQSPGKPDADEPAASVPASAPASAPAPAPAATITGGVNPCSLVADTQATFGQAVTAERKPMPNNTIVCEWKSAEGRLCGSVTPFGAQWNPVPAVKPNYDAMVQSMGSFGKLKNLAGVGEEAKIVDGGMLGVQIAVRTSDAAALVVSACSSGTMDAAALAQKVAREIADKL